MGTQREFWPLSLTLDFAFDSDQHSTMDYYAVLGVANSATDAELKKAFRKMAVKWHPDRNADNREEATARFDEIAEAYEVLSDAQRRGVYDQYGEDGLKRGVPAGEGLPGFAGYTYSGDADALFVAMFGGESPFTMFVD